MIEAARMSTGKGFLGWCDFGGDVRHKRTCPAREPNALDNAYERGSCNCKPESGDEKLLRYLYEHRHTTPFEMAGLVIEVQAPILVFREWHRHRTQSYNEMSARYVPLPDVNYRPTKQRIIDGHTRSGANRQAGGLAPLNVEQIDDWLLAVDAAYLNLERTYQFGLSIGISKEVARVVLPVGRYSRMRASANLHNWLKFLELRTAPEAQWEIRQFADAVGRVVAELFPRTWALAQAGRGLR